MRSILVLGAGLSSSALIKYLLDHSQAENWNVTVADFSLETAKAKTKNHANARAIAFDIHNENQRAEEIKNADIVISLLPPGLHYLAAADCIRFKKNLITASYVSEQTKNLENDAAHAGILLLNEMGLDPGIDHMSAMQIIHRLKSENTELISFKSYTGGLVAPEFNDNPWGYKFTWNPRNVILAGQGTAKYIQDGKYRYIPYSRLFKQIEIVEVQGLGIFDGYANRDSLAYRHPYEIENIPTILRGTLRNHGFCEAWNVFVQLGLTDDSFIIENSSELTYSHFVEAFLPSANSGKTLKSKVAAFCGLEENSEVIKKVEWTGIFEDVKINLDNATPARILQDLLQRKWVLKAGDKDMIVMQHEFEFLAAQDKRKKIISSLIVQGDDSEHTAMAKTVGLPMAIAARLILNEKIKLKGVKIPVMKEIYEPVLNELKSLGIIFSEKHD
ncbi:MAG TPA: saccharopine dehydrogenase C-terminal domain-containing protein [Bacteroidia bacterium]|nr:saccharopine dehydrogenase C-terminal domain-containing protein [Bacteroidia bacterium]